MIPEYATPGRWAMMAPGLSPMERLVLMSLVSIAEESCAVIDCATLAESCGVDISRVSKAIERLERGAHIARISSWNRKERFYVAFHAHVCGYVDDPSMHGGSGGIPTAADKIVERLGGSARASKKIADVARARSEELDAAYPEAKRMRDKIEGRAHV